MERYERIIPDNIRLAESVERSIEYQKIILKTETIMNIPVPHKNGKVIVSNNKFLKAAHKHKSTNGRKKIAVLNTAHGHEHVRENPLYNRTTLYPCVCTNGCKELFYTGHVDFHAPYNHDMIYTPGVTVFKTFDPMPEIMEERAWYDINVITTPGINFTKAEDEDMIKAFEERFVRIMKVAFHHDVDTLILDAFSCDDFDNDPMIVATAAARALEKYRYAFDTVEFAIPTDVNTINYRMFKLVLDRYMNNY